jgi:hypothetical protein
MGIGRSTFYDTPDARASDAIIVAEMKTICDQFEAYGYRRVDAELRHRGIVVNAKKIRRLMREHALNPKQRRRFIATTDSDHNYPIFPDLAKNMMPDSPNQLWVADITYVTIATGFVYLAAILDAWSRRVVGYAEVAGTAEGPSGQSNLLTRAYEGGVKGVNCRARASSSARSIKYPVPPSLSSSASARAFSRSIIISPRLSAELIIYESHR